MTLGRQASAPAGSHSLSTCQVLRSACSSRSGPKSLGVTLNLMMLLDPRSWPGRGRSSARWLLRCARAFPCRARSPGSVLGAAGTPALPAASPPPAAAPSARPRHLTPGHQCVLPSRASQGSKSGGGGKWRARGGARWQDRHAAPRGLRLQQFGGRAPGTRAGQKADLTRSEGTESADAQSAAWRRRGPACTMKDACPGAQPLPASAEPWPWARAP